MRHYAFLILPVFLLSACSDSPKMVSGTIEGVAYRFDGSDEEFKEVNGLAKEDCAKAGRISVLKNTSPVDDAFIANFACVKES